MYTHIKNIVKAGVPAEQAKQALIMLHGRGASAESMVPLSRYLDLSEVAILAPQATRNSWYPTSFIAPVEMNQPALDSALEMIGELVKELVATGIAQEQICFLGFSQGACLALEYVSRNVGKYGGVVAFTGGLIGEELKMENYKGDFQQTPVLITTSDPDAHVPLSRVEETVAIMESMNADVQMKAYQRKQHTITNEEVTLANTQIFSRMKTLI